MEEPVRRQKSPLIREKASRDWPGDTINPDGAVRTPIWKQEEVITREQYEVVQDKSMRNRYGTRTLARAKPDTNFYYRMAAWPAAFEEGMILANRRHFPDKAFSVYGQGHSTGGPFVCMLSQRIGNMAGICATEHSPFGYLCSGRDEWGGDMGKITGYQNVEKHGKSRTDPFNELYIRTWRDFARYEGRKRSVKRVRPRSCGYRRSWRTSLNRGRIRKDALSSKRNTL